LRFDRRADSVDHRRERRAQAVTRVLELDAAVLVDPYDVESIAEGIERVLSNPALSAELRAKGIARAREFSWEQSVARTRELYQEVGGRH